MRGEGFLDIIKRVRGDDNYAGDEYGGAAGADGSGLPNGTPRDFMFATGIECSCPTIEHGRVRRDLMEECGHYGRWKEDLGLVKELGLKVLRYGLPYHRIHLGPGKYDWEFADQVMREIKRLELTPILDLLHFGVPEWLGDFQNPELPIHFSDYAEAVARRYPWVRFYTPVNEIYVTARISARDGRRPVERTAQVRPRLRDGDQAPGRRQHPGDTRHRPQPARRSHRDQRECRIHARGPRQPIGAHHLGEQTRLCGA